MDKNDGEYRDRIGILITLIQIYSKQLNGSN